MTVDIYGLVDPRSGAVRYIGKANNAAKRFAGHKREMSRRKTPVYAWMRKLAREGLCPSLVILEQPATDWQSAERRLISEARRRGDKLLNVADGGDEPYCSTSVRAANGRKVAANRNKVLWRLKRDLGDCLRRGFVNERTKAKMRMAATLDPKHFGEWASI